ncbi:hypothetical protein [Spirillospora sp. CA-294931]|uniref:hypothetical protein n=1 Tax=Spirillospora sp. CA-294931 TaxID=3240042 RepID=UPI003D8C6DDE
MRDSRACDERGRLARLLVIAFGVLGFVVVPVTGTAQAGSGVGARTGTTAVQKVPSRSGKSKPCPVRAESGLAALARQLAPEAPTGQVAVLPPGVEVVPPVEVFGGRGDGSEAPCAAAGQVPRGRSPPVSPGF